MRKVTIDLAYRMIIGRGWTPPINRDKYDDEELWNIIVNIEHSYKKLTESITQLKNLYYKNKKDK